MTCIAAKRHVEINGQEYTLFIYWSKTELERMPQHVLMYLREDWKRRLDIQEYELRLNIMNKETVAKHEYEGKLQ